MPAYATVILTIPDEDGFTYRVPEELAGEIAPGIQVIVPFGPRILSGIVIEVSQTPPPALEPDRLKAIVDVVDTRPVVSGELIRLIRWIADYYVCHLGEAFRLIQSGINVEKSRLLLRRLSDEMPAGLTEDASQLLSAIPNDREMAVNRLSLSLPRKKLLPLLRDLERRGLISRRYSRPKKKTVFRMADFYRINPAVADDPERAAAYRKILDGKPTRGRQVLEFLKDKEWVAWAELKSEFNKAVLTRLVARGLLEHQQRERQRTFDLPYREEQPDIRLTEEQAGFLTEARKSLEKREFRPFLLHGITGSGKTQVYIELIREVLATGRQVIVLIPEIVLTPQTVVRFRHYFGEQVGIVHSRLSAAEKREVLHRIRQGEFSVVIGPRSAVFAPVPDLGLIVVDEEHESSYKQTDAQPHYHARDVAIYRASLNNALVVLGSATPSFESLYNAINGRYHFFQLMKRIQARMLPRVSVIDLKEEWKKAGGHPVISENLELKIESRLLTREQVMILQNRRGYAPYLLCQDCGYVAKCPNCDITLTYHQRNHELVCHYCGHREPAPDVCPQCRGMDILYRGIGTQRLEQELNERFPHARTLRMDQDTTRGRHGHLRILEKFRAGDADILIGTKMIAKGLDFRRVTLVGITSADQGLHFPDFRANEKVFQLLTQAAGRAGRGAHGGEVVVQTFDTEHFIFRYLLTHDYMAFYQRESESRKALKYPPFARLILIRLEGTDLKAVESYAESIVKFLWKANTDRTYSVLGPAPSPIARIQNKYRYQILIKQPKSTGQAAGRLRLLLKKGLLLHPDRRKWPVKVIIDVDPTEIL